MWSTALRPPNIYAVNSQLVCRIIISTQNQSNELLSMKLIFQDNNWLDIQAQPVNHFFVLFKY